MINQFATPIAAGVKFADLLDAIFVIYPPACKKEGEEENKILFYHPKNENVGKKMHYIGFGEATIKFSDTFNPGADYDRPLRQSLYPNQVDTDSPYYEVCTEKQLQIYCKLDINLITGCVLNRIKCEQAQYVLHSPAIFNILITAFRMFKLFFASICNDATLSSNMMNIQIARDKLDYFYTRYLATLRVHCVPLLDVYGGVQYMNADAVHQLRIQQIIADLENSTPMKHVIFLYQDQLLYHSIPLIDLPIIYRYLVNNLLPMSMRAELVPLTPDSISQRRSISGHLGRFVTGPQSLESSMTDTGKLPVINVTKRDNEREPPIELDLGRLNLDLNRETEEYNLVVYRALNTTIVILINVEKMEASMDFFRKLDCLLGAQMTSLASDLFDAYSSQQIPVDFLYCCYDSLTMGVKSNLFNWSPDSNRQLSAETIKLLCELRDELLVTDGENSEKQLPAYERQSPLDFASSGLGTHETLVKTQDDIWIYSRILNHRHVTLVLPSTSQVSTGSLLDAHERIIRILTQHFGQHFNMLTPGSFQLLRPTS